ncbi:hypothetical protein Sjap_007114 [Stephania japonica]|uniref:Uncharacterized protein n=1 Tax=Stephania japonica TaxID=461633 RepID=A0AAP0JMT4_9MAGN
MVFRVLLKAKGKLAKGSKGVEDRLTMKCLKDWSTRMPRKSKVITHYRFIPLVIIIDMNYEPKPHFCRS